MVAEYPNYSKSYTGLADAYYKDNNKGLAVKNYRLSLKLDPHNSYTSEMIKKLERLWSLLPNGTIPAYACLHFIIIIYFREVIKYIKRKWLF